MRAAALCILAVSLLAGCASLEPVPESSPVSSRHEDSLRMLDATAAWHASGRFAARSGQEGWHGRLEWAREGEAWQLRLVPPVLGDEVRLSSASRGVILSTADGRQHWAADPDALLRDSVGFSIPVTGLRYWLVGLSRPDADAEIEYGPRGLPASIRQDGWVVHYNGYRAVQGVQLPDRLVVENQDARLKFVVDVWELRLPDPASCPDKACAG